MAASAMPPRLACLLESEDKKPPEIFAPDLRALSVREGESGQTLLRTSRFKMLADYTAIRPRLPRQRAAVDANTTPPCGHHCRNPPTCQSELSDI
jgi:hypothetical protein